MLVKEIFRHPETYADQEICLQGWVKQSRISKNVSFLILNDGSFFKPIQVVVPSDLENYQEIAHLSNASSIEVKGKLVLTPQAKQAFELAAETVTVLDACEEDYPLQNKRQSFEFLRQYPALRSRTNTFMAVFRLRSEIAYAIHAFFHQEGFTYVHTPILTASDAEGAGEMFQATTLDLDQLPLTEEGAVDYRKDFFSTEAHLTVSGQLEVEPFIMSHRNVYTFGPTFRAEKSNTTRHAAEFWMIEPEMAFADNEKVMDNAEAMVKFVIHHVRKQLPEEMAFFTHWIDPGLLDRLDQVEKGPFARMTYTEAIEILEKENDRFDYPVHWGSDIQSEHERYLTEQVVGGPLFLTNYPKEIKAFYMKQNADGKTVACFDMLVPGIGELIGGSEREDDAEKLQKLMEEKGMRPEGYQWYINLRRYGGCVHGGYGLGFERLVMYLSGMSNIRDVLPYPRTVGSL